MKIDLLDAAEFLRGRDYFQIYSHISPDGDTTGSAYALCRALQKTGRKARIVCAEQFSKKFSYMYNGIEKQEFTPETFVAVDVADKKLLGHYEKDACKIQLAIDHHLSHIEFAEKILIDSGAAACSEVVFRLISALGVEMDEKIAACIYTGIATDTGCFCYPNTTAQSHLITAQLMKYAFNIEEINYTLFDLKSRARIKVEQKVLSEIEFFCDGKCAMAVLTKEMLASVDIEETNGLSSIAKQIEGVEVGVTIKEKEGAWKISMRSARTADVEKICKEFGGGGHLKAAGCTIKGNIEDVKKMIAGSVEKELKVKGLA